MKKIDTTLIKIKRTKSIEMYYDTELNGLWIYIYENKYLGFSAPDGKIFIPMNKVIPAQRGITSCIQRFYRKRTHHK